MCLCICMYVCVIRPCQLGCLVLEYFADVNIYKGTINVLILRQYC